MGQAWDFFWPWCNLKDGRSITWIIGQDRIALQTSCKRQRRLMASSLKPFLHQSSMSPPQFALASLPSLEPSISSQP
jgi:hypothetical protein